tara:strand:- start:44721 stop:46853 length:2133 start_codon:yes stop_codon:yes gene_type:complete
VIRGTQVGNYQIEEQIGEGGMGVVYSAKHARMTGRAVVKVLHKQFAHNPSIAKRFENEANAAASIGHPGIVQIFDVGTADDGSLYIVMELLEGESLQARVNRLGKLPVAEALSIIRQAAGALGAAHAAGIVHRDLKPDNLFLVPDPEVAGGERVKILDFGIAKLTDAAANEMNTGTGAMLGTPHYMSPEQCRGAGEVDYRTDLYALGCILFLLITGRTPFIGTGAGEFIAQHLTQPPPSLRTLNSEAPSYLEDLTRVLLAKDPEQRFQSTDALIAAIDGFATSDEGAASIVASASTGVSTSPPAASGFQGNMAKAVPSTLGASAGQVVTQDTWQPAPPKSKALRMAAGVALLAAGAASVFFFTRGEKSEPGAATEPAQSKAAIATPKLGLAAFEQYKAPQGSAITDLNSKTWWQAVANDFRQAATQDGAPPLWHAGEIVAEGFVAIIESDADLAVKRFQEAVAVAPEWGVGHTALSIGLSRQRKFDEALASAQEAQRIEPTWPGAIAAGARVLVTAERFDDAIQEYRRALALDKNNPNFLAELSLVYHTTHVNSEAMRYAKMALAIDEDLVGPRILLAERALEDKDGEAALAEASRAVATAPLSISAHLAYADALILTKDKDAAKQAYEKVVALHEASADKNGEHAERIKRVSRALSRKRLPKKRDSTDRSRRINTEINHRSAQPDSPIVKPAPMPMQTRDPKPSGRKGG